MIFSSDDAMKTMSALEARNRFGELIEAAQRHPVVVTKKGRKSVVVLSAADYERRRRRAWKNLLKFADGTGRFAVGQGLTEEKLADLLTDES